MALTEHHFVLLYSDKICAVDILTDKVVYLETLDFVSRVCRPDSNRTVTDQTGHFAARRIKTCALVDRRVAQNLLDAHRDEHL